MKKIVASFLGLVFGLALSGHAMADWGFNMPDYSGQFTRTIDEFNSIQFDGESNQWQANPPTVVTFNFTADEFEKHIYDYCIGSVSATAELESCGTEIGICKNTVRDCLKGQDKCIINHLPEGDEYVCDADAINACEGPGSAGKTAKDAVVCQDKTTEEPCTGDCGNSDQPDQPKQPDKPKIDQPKVEVEPPETVALDSGTSVVSATPGSLFEGSGCSLQVVGTQSGLGLWNLLFLAIPALGLRRRK